MGKVNNTTEAVMNDMVKELGVEHVVRQERGTHIRSTYSWSTDYARERFEEHRSVNLPEGETVDTVYVYQLLMGADLTHMVIFNAHNQGVMEGDEFIEILASTKAVLKKAVPLIKQAKLDESEVVDELYSMYKRLKEELEEYDLW